MYGIAFGSMAIPIDPAYPVILSKIPCRNRRLSRVWVAESPTEASMAKKLRKRIYQKATEAERKRHALIREQAEAELPDIKRRAGEKLREALSRGVAVRQVVSALKAERQRQGLSLADLKQRTGIERSTLSRLENNEDANSTVTTLSRYADAGAAEPK